MEYSSSRNDWSTTLRITESRSVALRAVTFEPYTGFFDAEKHIALYAGVFAREFYSHEQADHLVDEGAGHDYRRAPFEAGRHSTVDFRGFLAHVDGKGNFGNI